MSTIIITFTNGKTKEITNSDLKNMDKMSFDKPWRIEPVSQGSVPILFNAQHILYVELVEDKKS